MMKHTPGFSRHKAVRGMLLACAAALLAVACSEKETPLGVELQDPSTLYYGIVDTAYCTAATVYDDTLLTSSMSSALVGCYSDPLFGNSEAILYTAISSGSASGLEFDENCLFDSVILSYAVTSVYGNSDKSFHDMHFEVFQLSENVKKDTLYYADDEIAIGSTCFFDGVVRMEESDSMVARIKLSDSFSAMLAGNRYDSDNEFMEAVKGLRVRIVNDGSPLMASVNLAASATVLTAYYHYVNGADTVARTLTLSVNAETPHFNRYINSYTGDLAVFNNSRSDSIDGASRLYLCPMGGTNVKLNFDSFVRQFKSEHPYAIIHYAELLLPVADNAPTEKPSTIVSFKYLSDGTITSVRDMYDSQSGYNGTYDADRGCYVLRITQHLQGLLRAGCDYGTLLVLNNRRSAAEHTIINGYDTGATAGKSTMLRFVYSE